MRIGLIADVHGNIHGLNACLEDIHRQNVDKILCAGDVVGYYPFVNEVIDALIKNNVDTIKGNHEAYFLGQIPVSQERFAQYSLSWVAANINTQSRKFIEQLPETYELNIDGKKLKMFHGSPWSIEDYIYPNFESFERFMEIEADWLVLGQTHIPMLRSVGPLTIINPGSCGQPRDYNPLASYAVLNSTDMEVEFRRVEYDIDAVCEKVIAEGLWKELATILRRQR
jgi:putative phosphoesterase